MRTRFPVAPVLLAVLALLQACDADAPPASAPAPPAPPPAEKPRPATPPLPPPVPRAPPQPPPAGFWTADELRRIDEGLAVLNCNRADLGFQKRPIDDPFRLEVVNRALDDPLSVGDEAQRWDEAARQGEPLALLDRAGVVLNHRGSPMVSGACRGPLPAGLGHRLPEGAQDALVDFLAAVSDPPLVPPPFARSEGTDEQRRASLLKKMLLSQVEKPSWIPEATDLADSEFLPAAKELPADTGTAWALERLARVARMVAALRAAPRPEGEPWKGRVRVGPETPVLVLYGYGDDVHEADQDAVLVIDLGGNDTWIGGASASVMKRRPVSVCIDLAGDDLYVGGKDLSFGAALGGVAIQWDCGGNDTWLAGHASLGAGICGVGILVDEGGDDVYRCRDFGIGAGAFGIGILLDKGGNDLYHADLHGEGFASTRGCGVLVDMGGNDVYDAGGVHVHAPLYNDRHQSLSQGFSIGMRPDASGGVGVLVDLKGNDRYTADIYGQGASYWYGLGILVDDDGNDTYCLGQYGQGSGIHLSAGILVDRAGSDLYYLKNGVGMGGAHDYSVGMLVDRGGDDYYAGSGGTQGGSLTNSVALLLDGGGNDGYAAVNPGGAQGGASAARGTGGIGLLLDAGGTDVYTEATRDGALWTKELVGAGLDDPAPPAAGGVGDPGTTSLTAAQAKEKVDRDGAVPGPDGKPVDDLDRLWKMACEWEVGDNRVIVPVARERLVALGAPARDRALERVGTKDGLESRAVETTLAKFPAGEVVPRLVERTREADLLVRKGAVRALASLGAAAAVDRLVEMLAAEDPVRATVLNALAGLKKAPPAVAGFLRSARENEGVAAALCLGSVGDEAAIGALAGALGPDTTFPVRLAALDRLGALGDAAVPALARLAGDATAPPMARRNALRALGGTKAAKAADPLLAGLRDLDPWVRLSAFQAAADLAKGLGPEKGAAVAAALAAARAAETDPLLKRLR